MNRLSVISCAVIVMLFLVAAPGRSQDQDQKMMPRSAKGACNADIKEFCKDIKPGGGGIWACLKSNEDRLSQDCKYQIALAREKAKEFNQACRADVNRFCEGILSGKGRIASCLKSHEAELSDTCRALFRR